MNNKENEKNLKKSNQVKKERFWEIDFFRGLAVVLMLGLHFLDDLAFFNNYQAGINMAFWYIWQRLTASIFLLLVGISLSIKYNKTNTGEATGREILKALFRRGSVIFGWGIIITILSRLFLAEGYIIFGVLHLIGISMMISYPFLKMGWWNLPLGLICIGLGIYLNNLRFSFSWLVWAGFTPQGFYTVDYFPLFPWFGVILLGIFISRILYRGNTRSFPLKDLSRWRLIKLFSFLGRHSLIIYLAHQPVFIFLLYLARAH